MNYTISFPLGVFKTSVEALEFIAGFLNFEIVAIASPKSYPEGYDFFDVDESKRLLTQNNDSSFWIADELNHYSEEKRRVVFRKTFAFSTDIFHIKTISRTDFRLAEFLENKVISDLSTICYYDGIKALWQSEISVTNYETFKRPHAHLKKKIDPSLPAILANQIDIFYNPGHHKLTYKMFLMASPEMWFGNQSMIYFEKERLLSFPKALKTEELTNGVIHINLFDPRTADYESETILSIQKEFRQWVRMDEIELKLGKKIN